MRTKRGTSITTTHPGLSFDSSSDGLSALPSAPVAPAPFPQLPVHFSEGPSAPELLHSDTLLPDLFDTTAAAFPDNPAIDFPPAPVTYADLQSRANQLAHLLRARGVGPDTTVALWLPRSPDLYIALLAILKTGAAYVPLDPAFPPDRISFILDDARSLAILTHSNFPHQHLHSSAAILELDKLTAELARFPTAPLPPTASPDDTAYIIYTSGTTGHPKGVPITHRSAVHLVRAESRLFHILPTDRIYQGFSVAFDASIEEIWLTFAAGATLVPATPDMTRAGPALAPLLAGANITVLSCVPTLLSLMHEDIPSLRLLIFGGEVCPPDLVRRWWKPTRRIVNTYGPTEATVTATAADCFPDAQVTIGRPITNYRIYLLDDSLAPLPPGQPGELCISGPGLSPGYLNRQELTAEKFIPNPFDAAPPFARLYRSGDLARLLPDGQIEFLGRIDSQVKLRGFRIELAEIETALRECNLPNTPRILQAAAAIYEDPTNLQHLIAYIVLPPNAPALDHDQVKATLRTRLPAYMVPAWLEVLPELPTLPSGKIDRKKLPPPKRSPAPGQPALEKLSPLESALAAAWQRLTGSPIPSRSADFFRDLGGHSLLVARLASEVRQALPTSDLAVADIYNHPTLEKLSAALQARTAPPHSRQTRPAQDPVPKLSPQKPRPHLLFAAAQCLCLYFILAFYSLQWLTPYLAYVWLIEHDLSRTVSIIGALGALLALYPLMLAATIALKWLLVGRLKPGNYPLYSFFHLRWWLMQRILDAVATEYLEATPLLNLYYRLMGAKIGKRVHFRSYNIGAFDLVSVGDDTVLDDATSLLAYTIEHGHLRLAPVTIGKRCHIGAGSLLQLNTRMADDSRLLHLSLLTEGTETAPGETWFGSPANRLLHAQPLPHKPLPVSTARRLFFASLQTLGIFLLPVVYLAALFPGLILLNDLAIDYGETWSLLFAPAVAVTFILLLLAEIIAVKWLLLGRVKEGEYPLYGWFSTRKWFVDQLMALSLDIMGPLYATLYLNPWYKALGAKMGRRAEISTASAASPDLLDIGDESFIADAVLLGPPTVANNRLSLQKVRIGKRAFVGNSALIPPGATIADSTLIGVLSTTPLTTPGAAEPDTTWLGSPAIFLPQRQTSTGFAENVTFKPSRRLIALRLFIEFFRITLPMTFFVVFTSLLITTVVEIRPYLLPWAQVVVFPLLYAATGLCATLFTILAKWLLIGRYKPAEKPLWSSFVWRSELVNSLHENLACAYLMDMCLGTPLLNWYFRALGMKIGKSVFLDTPEFTEFDLVTLGDNAILNIESTIQTHLFEDRIMKMSTVSIGPNCSVGACAVVLYDTALGRDSILEELSLVMKGESLPDASRWHGTPARRVSSCCPSGPTPCA